VKTISCICGTPYTKSFSIGYKDDVKIVRCSVCNHWYIPKVADDYNKLYESGIYHNDYQVSIGHVPYKDRYDHDYEIAKLRLDNLSVYRQTGFVRDKDLLDIGCSNGAFVHRAREYGYKSMGIDLEKNTGDIEYCCSGTIDSVGSKTRDIITMFDSIEHFVDINHTFGELVRILKPNGLLAIEAPDFSCQQFLDEGINWKHVRPLEHIHMLSIKDYVYLLQKYGFGGIEISFPIEGKLCIYSFKE
jgi:SAM-dependent methyltransferase